MKPLSIVSRSFSTMKGEKPLFSQTEMMWEMRDPCLRRGRRKPNRVF
jgi:hypothetical protein